MDLSRLTPCSTARISHRWIRGHPRRSNGRRDLDRRQRMSASPIGGRSPRAVEKRTSDRLSISLQALVIFRVAVRPGVDPGTVWRATVAAGRTPNADLSPQQEDAATGRIDLIENPFAHTRNPTRFEPIPVRQHSQGNRHERAKERQVIPSKGPNRGFSAARKPPRTPTGSTTPVHPGTRKERPAETNSPTVPDRPPTPPHHSTL